MLSLFISFEGGDGSGKSTRAHILAERLADAGYPVTLAREPGSTPLGEYLRAWLKQRQTSPIAEALLFEAGRAELVAQVVEPALGQGRIVICDRYADSTIAYQGFGRQLPLKALEIANDLPTGGRTPSDTILLHLLPEEGLRRRMHEEPVPPNEAGSARFEEEELAFHRRVEEGYHWLARQQPGRWRVVNGLQGTEDIAAQIWAWVKPLLAQTAHSSPRGALDLRVA